jgi:arylformamidase
MSHWIDISVPLQAGTVRWPGDRPFEVERDYEIRAGAAMNLSWFSMSAHTGTHMDAPLHFLNGAASLDELPLEAVIGPARVIAVRHPASITVEEIGPQRIEPGERILFKTENSRRRWHDQPFDERFVAIPAETARYLAGRAPALIGVDYLSVGAYEGDGDETHRALLGAGIWLVEGLNLSEVEPGRYDLVCLPLRIAGIEGAPARAVLRRV